MARLFFRRRAAVRPAKPPPRTATFGFGFCVCRRSVGSCSAVATQVQARRCRSMAMLHCASAADPRQVGSSTRAGRVLARRRPRANRGAMAEAQCVAGSASAGASILERARACSCRRRRSRRGAGGRSPRRERPRRLAWRCSGSLGRGFRRKNREERASWRAPRDRARAEPPRSFLRVLRRAKTRHASR